MIVLAGGRSSRGRPTFPEVKVSIDEQHVALPKLYGQPAYARPPRPIEHGPKPFNPDELPLERDMSDDERSFAAGFPARNYLSADAQYGSREAPAGHHSGLLARPFRIRSLAGRLLGGSQ
jgi:hypothetical protein